LQHSSYDYFSSGSCELPAVLHVVVPQRAALLCDALSQQSGLVATVRGLCCFRTGLCCRESGACEQDLESLALLMGHSVKEQRGTYDRRTKSQKVQPAVDLMLELSHSL
jgi:hypothetical protein